MMRLSPRFSVVIPAFNSAPFIAATFQSLANQTQKDFEVIVVDDRSTDDTRNVAAQLLAEHQLRGEVRVNDRRKGVSTSRNIGIEVARGEWIAFLDSDDLFAPSKLQRISEAIDRWGQLTSVVYHPAVRFEDGTGRHLGTVVTGEEGAPRGVLDRLLSGNFLATCGLVVRTSLLRELSGFDVNLHGVEDYWLGIELAVRTPFLFVDEPLAYIRVRSDSLMGQRHFSHYAQQHALLLRTAERSPILSRAQRQLFRSSLWSGPTRWHAGRCFEAGGWSELFAGVRVFLRSGEENFALRLVTEVARQRAKLRAIAIARRLGFRSNPHPSAS
jgi:glycosyltransferase involved in cell wall biosynthesis